MGLFFNPFTGNIEFKLVTGGGGGGSAWNQGGNSFGALGTLGTNDGFGLNIRTNGVTALNIDTTQAGTFSNVLIASGGGFRTGTTGGVQITGAPNLINQAGLELFMFNGAGTLQALDRGPNTPLNLNISGADTTFFNNSSTSAILSGADLSLLLFGSLKLNSPTPKIAIDTLAGIVMRVGLGFGQFNIAPDTITLNSVGSGTTISCANQISFNRGAINNALGNIGYQFFNASYQGTGSLIVLNPNINLDVTVGTPTVAVINISPSFTNFNAGSTFYGMFTNIPDVVPLGGLVYNLFIGGTAKSLFQGAVQFDTNIQFKDSAGGTYRIALNVPALNTLRLGNDFAVINSVPINLDSGNVNFAPLKFNSGILTAGAGIKAGNMEYGGDDYFLTASTGLVRKVIRDLAYRGVIANRTLDGGDEFIDCTTNTFTITLPTAVGYRKQYTIFNSGAGVITINTTGGETINGFASGTFTLLQFDCIIVRSNGTNWYKIN
jgi:hypothetical protein